LSINPTVLPKRHQISSRQPYTAAASVSIEAKTKAPDFKSGAPYLTRVNTKRPKSHSPLLPAAAASGATASQRVMVTSIDMG